MSEANYAAATKWRHALINLTWDEGCDPQYATRYAAGADVVAKETAVAIPAGKVVLVDTGVRIASVELDQYPGGVIVPELQLRARSSLAKDGIFLANGVGTIDCDYRGNIFVPLYNSTDMIYQIQAGDKIAQLTLGLRPLLAGVTIAESDRDGGFGSTGKKKTSIIISK